MYGHGCLWITFEHVYTMPKVLYNRGIDNNNNNKTKYVDGEKIIWNTCEL